MMAGRAALLVVAGLAMAEGLSTFECPSDTILRFGADKRMKEFEKECLQGQVDTRIELLCESTDMVKKTWQEFLNVADQYSKAVTDCRATVEKNKKRVQREADGEADTRRIRRAEDHDPKDPNVDHTGHGHRKRRAHGHDPNDPNIDHSGHSHRRRSAGEHDPNDPNEDHTGHNHRRRSTGEHDPNDPTVDHTGHAHRRRSADNHDPNDPNEDHTGHNHRRRSTGDHDPNDPNEDHTGHNHKRRSAGEHDPNDPNEDHTGHNHKRRSTDDHDPHDPNQDHTGHNHRRRHVDGHDPNDPSLDHTGHAHRKRRAHQLLDAEAARRRRCATFRSYRDDGPNPCDPQPVDGDHRPGEEDDRIGRRERDVDVMLSRARRGADCSLAGQKEFSSLQQKYATHCDRENICLPDEDLGPRAAEDFKKLHKRHAQTYAAYVRELAACYGKLAT